MSKFKDRLWRELVRDHGEDLAQITRPEVTRSRRARPRVLAGTSLGLAGVGAAVALVLGAASTAPAFAVTPNHDGTVQVVIFRGAGIAGANAKLSAMGIRARVIAVSVGCRGIHWAEGKAPPPRALHAALQARIDPRKIAAGRTLVLATWRKGQRIVVTPASLVRGAPPACLPPIPPGCPPAPTGNSGNSGNSGTRTTMSSGGSGTLKPVPKAAMVPPSCQVRVAAGPPSSGNSGDSGNSGNSDNSGNN